jgi:hypothetical protein
MKSFRIQDKQRENARKPLLKSDDILYTTDFTFSKIRTAQEGDSGPLLLAKRKTNPEEQYLVKHAFTDCAANEYIYYKLCNAMNIKTPQVKLFNITEKEERDYFITEYVMAAVYYEAVIDDPPFDSLREASNWYDYFKCQALEIMFGESDGMEFILTKDNYIYRVDTTSAFPVSNYYLDSAGVNIALDENGKSTKEIVKETLLNDDLERHWHADLLYKCYQNLRAHHGMDAVHFLTPLKDIQTIPDAYIDDFLNTLCYFYPDFIGEYYKKYIAVLQKLSKRFLYELKDNGFEEVD